MSLPVVKQCCCGCSLETGCKIIGWMQIVCCPVSVVEIIAIHFLDKEHYVMEPYVKGFGFFGIFLFVIIPLCASIQGTILVLGIRRKKPGYLSVWVISTFFVVITMLSFVTYIYVVVSSYHPSPEALLENFFSFVIAGPCIAVISIYYAIVVSSFKKELRKPQNEMTQLSEIQSVNPESDRSLEPSTNIPTPE